MIQSILALGFFFSSGVIMAQTPPGRAEAVPIRLKRVKVLDRTTIALFSMVDDDSNSARLIFQLATNSNPSQTSRTKLFSYTPHRDTPLRWDLSGDSVIYTDSMPRLHQRTSPFLVRYLVTNSNHEMKSSASQHMPQIESGENLLKRLNTRINLSPIGAAYMFTGWEIGDEPIRNGLYISKERIINVHFDIRTLNTESVELYLTVNGKLTRWLLDSKKWTLAEKYTAKIHGPFLVYRDGKAIISEIEGQWCVIDNLQQETPNISVLMDAPPEESLVLIEDVVLKTNYFQLGRSLYDEEGVKLAIISATTKPAQRMTEALEIVLSQRR